MLTGRVRRLLYEQKGFTLVEMCAIIIIIVVLIGMGYKFFSGYIGNARVGKAKADMTRMQSGLEVFYAQFGYYPSGGGPDAQEELAMAGINPNTVSIGVASSGYSYVYMNTAGSPYYTAYKIESGTALSGSDYVMATGDSGTPSPPVTTTSPP
jgi:Tfp pilus assembly protein PilE